MYYRRCYFAPMFFLTVLFGDDRIIQAANGLDPNGNLHCHVARWSAQLIIQHQPLAQSKGHQQFILGIRSGTIRMTPPPVEKLTKGVVSIVTIGWFLVICVLTRRWLLLLLYLFLTLLWMWMLMLLLILMMAIANMKKGTDFFFGRQVPTVLVFHSGHGMSSACHIAGDSRLCHERVPSGIQ